MAPGPTPGPPTAPRVRLLFRPLMGGGGGKLSLSPVQGPPAPATVPCEKIMFCCEACDIAGKMAAGASSCESAATRVLFADEAPTPPPPTRAAPRKPRTFDGNGPRVCEQKASCPSASASLEHSSPELSPRPPSREGARDALLDDGGAIQTGTAYEGMDGNWGRGGGGGGG